MKKLLITLALLLIPSLVMSAETKRTTDGFLGYLVDNSSTGTSALSGVRMVNDANTTMGIYLTSSNYSDSDTNTGLITGILKLIMDTDVSVSSGHTFSIGSEQWNSGDKIDSSQLDAVDVPADEECYTWEDGSTKGEWQACAAGGDMTKLEYDADDDGLVTESESDQTWTEHDDYPVACYAGEFVTEIGDVLTCAAEDDPEVDAVTADKWCKGDGSAVQCASDDPGFQRTQEEIDDFVDALINDGDSVHTRITITYDDADNAMDYVVDAFTLDDVCDESASTDQEITVGGLYIDDTNSHIDVDGSNNLIFIDAVAGTRTLDELGSPTYIYITASAQPESNLNLSDGTNWNVDKALIKTMMVGTNATTWDGTLYMDDDFDDATTILSLQFANDYNQTQDIYLDYPYHDEDDSKEVHLQVTDNSGTATFELYIMGYRLR